MSVVFIRVCGLKVESLGCEINPDVDLMTDHLLLTVYLAPFSGSVGVFMLHVTQCSAA